MGRISDIASMQKAMTGSVDNSGQSSTIPMAKDYDRRRKQRKPAKKIGNDSGICDDENDWLARQLKEEEAVLKRMEEEYGLRHFRSPAQKLRVEHALQHEYERQKGIRR